MSSAPTLAASATLRAPAPDLTSHLATHGAMPVLGGALIRRAHDAGLLGRGGAGFPTARKLAAVAGRRGRPVVVANGTEGEPLSAKDKVLLTRSPHLVLDGIDAAADAVGASRRILCIERDHRAVHAAVATALAERGDSSLEVVATPRRYLAGQETALVDWINGGPGRPTLQRPFERGVASRPTLVDNVETLARLALVARGSVEATATTLVTVTGAVERPGVYEVAVGAPVPALLDLAGAAPVRAVLFGGYFGRWVAGRDLGSLRLDAASLASVGAGVGCGVLAVLDDRCCAIAELARVAEWFAASSAGQCGACTWGLRDLASAAGAVAGGSPGTRAASDLRRWTGMVRGRGACKLPDGAADFLESGIAAFGAEVEEHRRGLCRRVDRRLLATPAPEPFT